MRMVALGLCCLAGFLVAQLGSEYPGPAQAQYPLPASTNGQGMIALSSEGESHQQVVLVDVQKRVMSVYHIDRQTGAIALKGVRNVQWDLLMEEYNGSKPLPQEIRRLLEQR